MEQLQGGYTLETAPGSFPLSTDSMALSGFVRLPKSARVLDLGSGCGTLGLLLCAKDPLCRVTGIELSAPSHEAALENIRRNGLEKRLSSICGDIRATDRMVSPGSFDICVSNPPYFSGGPASGRNPLARRDDCCSMDELFRAAGWAVRHGGDFFLVHRPERLAELFTCAGKAGLEPKRLCLLRHKAGGPVALTLVQCRKGARPGLAWEEMHLYEPDGTPSAAYRELYHL